MKRIITILILITCINIYGQTDILKTQFVNAKNGLFYRDKPNGKILGKFEYGSRVNIIEITKQKMKIKDNNKIIIGKWVKVYSYTPNSVKIAYAFNGYLVDNLFEPKKEFKLIIPNKNSINELNGKIFKYLKKYYGIKTKKINVFYNGKELCSFEQFFSNNISYTFDNCHEAGFDESVFFPKTDIKIIKKFIETFYYDKEYSWLSENIYGIEGVGCTYTIENKKNRIILTIRCGC